MKLLKIPEDLLAAPYNNKALLLDGFSVVDSCFYTEKVEGRMFLEEHVLLYVVSGQIELYYGAKTVRVQANELVVLRRATSYRFVKTGINRDGGHTFHGLLFCLNDSLLREFIKLSNLPTQKNVPFSLCVKPASRRIKGFADSILLYLEEQSERIDDGLLRIKMFELFYDIVDADEQMLQQLICLDTPQREDLMDIMEHNYKNPVSVPDLAYLSGRSLSSFKREFKSRFGISPTEWIRHRRLEEAHNLLKNGDVTISGVCYAVGFENPTHFTRLFKQEYGVPPSNYLKKGE